MEEPDIIVINNKYCCRVCNKQYTNKSSLVKHKLLCDFKAKTEREKTIDFEEVGDMPNQVQLVKIVQELALKVIKLEQKIEEMQKYVDKKKKKINVIEWLNTNVTPETNFENLNSKIIINEDDIKCLFEHTFIDVLNQIFSRTIYNNSNKEYPIFAFIQKTNIFYIYENDEVKWIELNGEKMWRFLDRIYMKISRAFSEWKKNNKYKMEEDENFQLSCDKTSVKLYSVDIKNETTLNKIKSNIYSRIKTDIKACLEYEFEF